MSCTKWAADLRVVDCELVLVGELDSHPQSSSEVPRAPVYLGS